MQLLTYSEMRMVIMSAVIVAKRGDATGEHNRAGLTVDTSHAPSLSDMDIGASQ